MLDYKRVLTLHSVNSLSGCEIAESVGSSKTTVNDFLKRFRECGKLGFPLKEEVSNEMIEELLYRKRGADQQSEFMREIDCEDINRRLGRKGVTLKMLWRIYNAVGVVDGRRPYSYRNYCRKYAEWAESRNVTFHIQRYPGVNLELDFAGKTLSIVDHHSADGRTRVTVFIATLSYSDYFYCEGLVCCDVRNWIRANSNALTCFGGATQITTPDNCKVAVTENRNWMDPVLNRDFQSWAEHYGTALMPAKVKSPKWKPNVENTVKLVTMHILAEMEQMRFFSLDELNRELWRRMDLVNRENFKGLTYSRWDRFESEEKDTLLPLPPKPFELLERQQVKVSPDFSFVFDQVHYTMPRKYISKTLEVRASSTEVKVFNQNGDLIRVHQRSYTPHHWVVEPTDMPQKYSEFSNWSVPYFQGWASRIGVNTRAVIDAMLKEVSYPVQAFRRCAGVLGFESRYGAKVLEKCCQDAVLYGKRNYSYIRNTIPSYVGSVDEKREDSADEVHFSTGKFKAEDSGYSLDRLLERQRKEVH